ncbi:MAG: ORF6N domain-containing protein [Paludibacteraceae bacterium]|nr:ORF6N domain-containing protein [Paludibacteraceae bacterium]
MVKNTNIIQPVSSTPLDTYTSDSIQSRILTIRGQQVIMDADLAEFYQVQTKALNQAVKRNIERFPERYRFQLTQDEKKELVTNCDRFRNLNSSHDRFLIIDDEVYHFGASIKDLGKRWFGVNLITEHTADELISRL